MLNTGSDGFASHYGSWRRISSSCVNYYANGIIFELGIAGDHPWGTYGGNSGRWNRCA